VFNETGIIVKEKTRTNLGLPHNSIDLVETTAAIELLIAEMGEGFYNYVNWIGLAKDPNLIVLSSQHYYFYDAEEMNNVKTVINLKELNKIKRVKSLLQSYLHFLPQKSNFVGYFVDNKKIDRYVLRNSLSYFANKKRFEDIENNIISRIPFINMLYSKLDFKTDTYMSESSVTLLLGDYGFKIMDMTEHNGFTFFHSQKVRDNYN
jgi:hypothetical protein